MPAPTDATYILQSPDTADLPGSRTLHGDSSLGIHLLDGGPGGTLTIETIGQLKSMAQAATSGLYILDASTDTFVRQGLNTNGTIAITNAGFVLDSDPTTPGNPVLRVVESSHVQKLNFELNGTLESTQSTLNFINGSGITIGVVNNGGSNRADVTISNSGNTGTVTSVTLSTSTGMFLVGQDLTTDVQWAVDLPPGGAEGDVLTVTTAGDPQVVGWQANTGTAAGWSHFPALVNVNMDGFGLTAIGGSHLSFGATNDSTPFLYSTATGGTSNQYLGILYSVNGTDGEQGYIMTTSTIPGAGYGVLGNIPIGNGTTLGVGNGEYQYTDLAAPVLTGTYELRVTNPTDAATAPFWFSVTSSSGVVVLGGDGTFTVVNANVTADSVIIATGVGVQGVTDPATGPVTVIINPGINFIISGANGGDAGNTAHYYIVSY